jgi:hypothetical protein
MEQSLQDSLLNDENIRQINEMNAVYEKDKQQQQIGVNRPDNCKRTES